MRTIEEAILIIKENLDRCRVGQPVENNIIETAEKELHIQFPASYKFFLNKLGIGCIKSQEIYGIVNGDISLEEIPNVVWYTKQQRINAELNEAFIPIYFSGDEFDFCLDTSRMKDGECPIVAVDVAGGEPEDIYPSFVDFLFDECISKLYKKE